MKENIEVEEVELTGIDGNGSGSLSFILEQNTLDKHKNLRKIKDMFCDVFNYSFHF